MQICLFIYFGVLVFSEENGKGKETSLLKQDGSYKKTKKLELRKHGCKNLKIFTFLYRKDIPKACFYSTLNLKRLSFNRRHFFYFIKMKKEESFREERIVNKTDSTSHAGNKVLPITEAPLSSLAERNDQCNVTLSKDQIKGDKKTPISRMKELLRWAASASVKTEKGGKFNGKKVFFLASSSSLNILLFLTLCFR